MYELIQLTENCFYIECPSKIGLVRINDTDVCLIDSGNNKETGRKVRQILEANSWKLKAIYNSHANADHIGGNKYLQGQTACKIYAPPINAALAKHPIISPSFLYGGFPPKELHNSFLLAAESEVLPLCEKSLPERLKSFSLEGHFFDMVGFEADKDVLFLADCLFSKQILEKYHIPFIYDVEAFLLTLKKVTKMEAKYFVPSHGDVTEDIASLVSYNSKKVLEIADLLCELCTLPLTAENILQKVFNHYKLKMDFNQYVLVGSTVKSFLTYLKAKNKVEAIFESNFLLWKAL